MYFNLIFRNSKKSYKENGIYFLTLLIAIISFYVLLSLKQQDVIVFLNKMESDALRKLFMLIRSVYIMSLFLLFFLVYFAQRYQLERRSHEIGIMMMLGAKRSSLFWMLMIEDVVTSGISLLVGLPVAVLLSEFVSLITARLIGLGVIGHHFSLSLSAILFTALGFALIKFLANLFLSARLMKREPAVLMQEEMDKKQKHRSAKSGIVWLLIGVAALLVAYGLGISGFAFERLSCMLLLLLVGSFGTYGVLRGFCSLLVRGAGKRKNKDVLAIFTFRQLQENVLSKLASLTLSSLLILIAIVCMAYGVAVCVIQFREASHTLDFTIEGYDEGIKEKVEGFSKREDVQKHIEAWVSVPVSYMAVDEKWREDADKKIEYDTKDVVAKLDNLSEEEQETFRYTSAGESLLPNEDGELYGPHILPLSAINALRRISKETPYELGEGEVLIYIDPEFYNSELTGLYNKLFEFAPKLRIDGKDYKMRRDICSENIVVDRSLTLGFGLVFSDEDYEAYKDEINETIYYNACIKQSLIEKQGLMQALNETDSLFAGSGMEYENYLQNMGRQTFYIVAASYLTIYMALLFLLIANTVVSLQFLMQQKKMVKRYRTLLCLGSDYQMLHSSTKRQIIYFFGVPVGMAVISGVFGIFSLLRNMIPSSIQDKMVLLFVVACAVIALLGVIEAGYMGLVSRMSRKNMRGMLKIKRVE